MAFVNERHEETGKPSRTIDYERDAVLRVGGRPWYNRVPGSYFTLTWKGQKIIFAQFEKIEIYKEDGSSSKVTYHIASCAYPDELKPYRDVIIEMIKEALDVYGVNYGKREGTIIEVIVDPKVEYLNPNYNWDTKK